MDGYGYCPVCGAPGMTRERRPNGNDRCMDGHVYPSKDALPEPLNQKDWAWYIVIDEQGNLAEGFNSKEGADGYAEEFGGKVIKVKEAS